MGSKYGVKGFYITCEGGSEYNVHGVRYSIGKGSNNRGYGVQYTIGREVKIPWVRGFNIPWEGGIPSVGGLIYQF